MADIQKIFTGMSQGPETINNDLNAINAELQNVGEWTDDLKDGLVALDNRVSIHPESHYNYLDISNCRLVCLHIILTVNTDIIGIDSGHLLQVPDAVAPAGSIRGVASAQAIWLNFPGSNPGVAPLFATRSINNDVNTKIAAGEQLMISTTYERSK